MMFAKEMADILLNSLLCITIVSSARFEIHMPDHMIFGLSSTTVLAIIGSEVACKQSLLINQLRPNAFNNASLTRAKVFLER